MFKFFKNRIPPKDDISREDIDTYRAEVKREMTLMGSSEKSFELITDEVIKNAIRANRSPLDVAFTLLE